MGGDAWSREGIDSLLLGVLDIKDLLIRCYNFSETMKKKRRSNREFFERHREHFERSERVHREWLEQFEAREAAKRKATNPENKP